MLYKVSFSASGRQLIVPITFEHCSLPLPTIPSEINSFTGNGLIDTGATHTAIVETILINLGMIPIGKVIVGTPSDQSVVCNQYMIKLTFPDTKQFIDNFRVTAMIAPIVTSHCPVHCLIGMDILRFGRFAYNGESDTFEYNYPQKLDSVLRWIWCWQNGHVMSHNKAQQRQERRKEFV